MRATDDETLSHPDYPLQNMYHPTTNHYITPTYFAPPSHPGHMHIVAQLPRPTNAPPQRKRPKYTRSKTGCLTCRAKKIKCDETKPNCMRCTHGQRECTWPEGVPARKKPAPKKQQTPSASDNRPSTAGSSGISDTSTPPTRNSTPPKEEQQTPDLNLPPMATRRHSEPYITLQPAPDSGVVRRQSIASLVQGSSSHGYQMHSTHSHILPVIPEMTPSYATLPRYNTAYSTPLHAHSPVHSIDSVSVPSRPSTSSSSGVRRVDHHHHSPHPHQMSQWANHAQPSVMVHMDPIEPYFHTVQERNLIRHYCDTSLSIIMAVPFENPIAAANVSLVFSRAPGSDPATEALRMALLGVAAVHQSFLLGRSGNGTGTSSNRSTDMMQFAQSLRMKSRLWLANACASVEGIQSDASLAASITVALMDIFTGGHRWMKNLDVAKNLVKTRGGPAAMLSRRTTSRPGVVTGASRARLLLEILTVYDIFGCLATGQEPSLLNSESTDWWLDESTARSHVEHVFGISAILVPLLAGIVSFVSRALNGKSQISDVSDDVTTPPAKGTTEYTMLQNLLDSWADPLGEVMARVHTGNTIYLNTAKIILLRDVGLVPPTDSVVQQCAETIITLCLQCAENKMSVDLNWPVIIAGSITYGAARYRVLDVFEIFRNQCCYEIDTSEQIVLEVWNRVDNDRSRADWRSVMKDLDLNVLIL